MISSSGKQNYKEVELNFLCLFHDKTLSISCRCTCCHIEVCAKVKISLPAFPQ